MEQVVLTAQLREERGKGAARKLRKQELIPAVLYGGKGNMTDTLSLSLNRKDVITILKDEMGANAILRLKLEGVKKRAERNIIFREIQLHPIRHEILHVDLYEISMDKTLHVEVPIELVGQATGVKDQGGILEHNLRSLNIECLPNDIPEHIVVDVSPLKLGKSIHVSDLQVPEGSKVLDDPEQMVVMVAEKPTEKAPVGEEITEAEAEAGTEAETTQKLAEAKE
jgi:large subunit ribosomal protein L25